MDSFSGGGWTVTAGSSGTLPSPYYNSPLSSTLYYPIGAPVKNLTGSKPVVVCAGVYVECDDMAQAATKAAELAHQFQQDAFVLKPFSKTAPKRDVVVTEL